MEEGLEAKKIDILNRQPFVNKLETVVKTLSANRKSCTFAVNGEWGCGKSFVMDMFEKDIVQIQSEETASDKYLLFHYDCWEYDYYEEPLFAIVSAVLDKIENETKISSIEKAKKLFQVAGKSLIKLKSFGVIENIKEAEKEYEKEHNKTDFDAYFNFKDTLKEVQKAFGALAEDRTLVVVVDELDRCLPTYTIKVLERLHHIFENVENCVVILAVDKAQIEHTVKTIYGEHCNTDAYLKKFIDFEVELDKGKISESFTEKYKEYISLFDEFLLDCGMSIAYMLSAILENIDARTQDKIIAKATLLHKMIFPKEQKANYAVMCAELFFLALCIRNEGHSFHSNIMFQYEKTFSNLSISDTTKTMFLYYRTAYTENDSPNKILRGQCFFDPSLKEVLPYFIYYWLNMYEEVKTTFSEKYIALDDNTEKLDSDIYYLKYFAQLADIIK